MVVFSSRLSHAKHLAKIGTVSGIRGRQRAARSDGRVRTQQCEPAVQGTRGKLVVLSLIASEAHKFNLAFVCKGLAHFILVKL